VCKLNIKNQPLFAASAVLTGAVVVKKA